MPVPQGETREEVLCGVCGAAERLQQGEICEVGGGEGGEEGGMKRKLLIWLLRRFNTPVAFRVTFAVNYPVLHDHANPGLLIAECTLPQGWVVGTKPTRVATYTQP